MWKKVQKRNFKQASIILYEAKVNIKHIQYSFTYYQIVDHKLWFKQSRMLFWCEIVS